VKLAHFSPLPPQRTGIADYAAQLLPALGARAEVDPYAPLLAAEPVGLPLRVLPLDAFLQRRHDYDGVLYHMGNHPAFHREIYEMLCRYPGVVLLHDVNLHAFFLNLPEPWMYVQAMGYEQGLDGVREARQAIASRQPVPVEAHVLAGRLAGLSLGLIVHSQTAARVLAGVTGTPVAVIPHGLAMPGDVAGSPDILAALPARTKILASFGFISPSKRLDVVLQTLAQLRKTLPPFRYLLVGEPVEGFDVEALIAGYDLHDLVLCTGYVDRATFARYLTHTDVGISLRTAPTGGEMSGALLYMMAHGQPVVVSDVGAFAELPAGAVWKIAQDEREAEALGHALQQLLAEPSLRRQMGEQARRYVQANHAFDAVAERILAFIQACTAGEPSVSSPA
jgi:glycosyltransferase involved in cell wall biosynthesis